MKTQQPGMCERLIRMPSTQRLEAELVRVRPIRPDLLQPRFAAAFAGNHVLASAR
jgi:hypothetical protein